MNLKKISIFVFILIITVVASISKSCFAINDNSLNYINDNKLHFDIQKTSQVIKPRMWQNVILLQNGEILITGGTQKEPYVFAEIYNSKTNTYREPKHNIKYGDKNGVRVIMNDMKDHSSILLDDGRVLLIGSYDKKPLLYNPIDESFKELINAPIITPDVSLEKIENSDVLIIDSNKAYRFNPNTLSFIELTFPDNIVKYGKKRGLVKTKEGNILLFGNGNNSQPKKEYGKPINRVYIFNIKDNTFSHIGNLIEGRVNGVKAFSLDDNNVIIIGGRDEDEKDFVYSVERYNINNNSSQIIGKIKKPGSELVIVDDTIIMNSYRCVDNNCDYIQFEAYDLKTNKSYYLDNIVKNYTPTKLIKLPDNNILVFHGREYKKNALDYFSKYANKFIKKI